MTEVEAWVGIKNKLGPQEFRFRERYQELLGPARDHCSGCYKCQSDYPCTESNRIMARMLEALYREFPECTREASELCFPSRYDDDLDIDDDWDLEDEPGYEELD